ALPRPPAVAAAASAANVRHHLAGAWATRTAPAPGPPRSRIARRPDGAAHRRWPAAPDTTLPPGDARPALLRGASAPACAGAPLRTGDGSGTSPDADRA